MKNDVWTVQPLREQAKAARDLIRKNVEYSLLEEEEAELMPVLPSKTKQSLKRKMRTRTAEDYGDDETSIRVDKNPRPRSWEEDIEDPSIEAERKKVWNTKPLRFFPMAKATDSLQDD